MLSSNVQRKRQKKEEAQSESDGKGEEKEVVCGAGHTADVVSNLQDLKQQINPTLNPILYVWNQSSVLWYVYFEWSEVINSTVMLIVLYSSDIGDNVTHLMHSNARWKQT